MEESITLPLTRNLESLLDPVDADLTHVKWYAHKRTAGHGYHARRSEWRDDRMTHRVLHREVLARKLGRPLERHEVADHINGDPLDNRRANLRLATARQNSQNRRADRGGSSRYLGVSFDAHKKRWRAQIRVNGKRLHLGWFADEWGAALAYNEAAAEHHGEFANLNERATGGRLGGNMDGMTSEAPS